MLIQTVLTQRHAARDKRMRVLLVFTEAATRNAYREFNYATASLNIHCFHLTYEQVLGALLKYTL